MYRTMYETKYKNKKGSEEKQDQINLTMDSQKEKLVFSPSLTAPKENHARIFVPNLAGTDKEERSFKPSLENAQKTMNATFRPRLESHVEKRGVERFTPSLEMPKILKTSVIPGTGGLMRGDMIQNEDIRKINNFIAEDPDDHSKVKKKYHE